ncbi:MAG TPA: S8 family serine peptidase [Candidatus Lumbricidophila sp.]|nr:S8 family serine peptidase [Candidatus Lumbricidophila sp.]
MTLGRVRFRALRAMLAAATAATLALLPATSAQADTARSLEYWLADYGFTNAWNLSKGAGVKIAVIDTGVDGSIGELQGAVVDGWDASGIGAPNGQRPIGSNPNHGTMVASLLAGRGTGPADGVIGVAPEASILSVSVAFGQDSGAARSVDDQIADAVMWAVDHGADVINMSLTRNTRDWPESWDRAFTYAFEHDVVVVAAAGNRGDGTTEVGAPATIPGVLTVAGVDTAKVASFDASSQGITIAVAAPSESLVGALPGGSHVVWNGTSGAAPLVAGLVALVRSKYPQLDAANVINRVIATANANGQKVPSPLYGHGLIDPLAALTKRVAAVTENPLGSLADWIRVHRRATPPSATAAPEPPVVPLADPPLPKAADRRTLLPNEWTLTYLTVPLVVVTAFGTLATLLGIAAARLIRRASRSRGP